MSPAGDLFDLHVHSVASDGLLTPMQLANLARRSGVVGLAITDHDVLSDPSLLDPATREWGVEWIAGVELSTQFDDSELHLLGYGFDPRDQGLTSACHRLQQARRRICGEILAALAGRGVRIDSDEARRILERPAPGRLHVARALVAGRYATSIRAAFARFLQPLTIATDGARVPFVEAVRLVQRAGGVAILAHPPHYLPPERWRAILEAGVDGLETEFPGVDRKRRQFLENVVADWKLVATAGSDYHGDVHRNYLGSRTASREAVDRLLARRRPVASTNVTEAPARSS